MALGGFSRPLSRFSLLREIRTDSTYVALLMIQRFGVIIPFTTYNQPSRLAQQGRYKENASEKRP